MTPITALITLEVKKLHKHEMPDAEKIKEILDVVSEKVPGLLQNLSDILYGPEQAKKYASAVAIFYKELKEAGMTDEQAFEMTKDYMANLNVSGMMHKFGHNCHD